MEDRNNIKLIINPWVILGALGFAGVLFGMTLLLLWITRPAAAKTVSTTPIVMVIAAPTSTILAPTAPPTQIPTPTSELPPAPPAGVISTGSYVQIKGTGGDGLRVRSDPGLNAKTVFVAIEDEVFEVKDGPQQVDGYTWWFLVAPYDNKYKGWAVANYLLSIQKP